MFCKVFLHFFLHLTLLFKVHPLRKNMSSDLISSSGGGANFRNRQIFEAEDSITYSLFVLIGRRWGCVSVSQRSDVEKFPRVENSQLRHCPGVLTFQRICSASQPQKCNFLIDFPHFFRVFSRITPLPFDLEGRNSVYRFS